MKSIFKTQFVITTIVLVTMFLYLKERYYIAFDQQDQPCLLTTVFLVDRWASADDFKQGDLMAYEYHMENTLLPKGMILVKRVAATPNSDIVFNGLMAQSNGKTFHANITGELDRLGVHMPNEVNYSTKEGEFFLVGETEYSYDSRYWGSAMQTNIVGKVYAIF